MPQLRVFVSHLTVESKFVDLLREVLRRDFIGMLDLFVSSDETSIPVGTGWFDGLLDALRRAELQFVVCSPASVERRWISYEAGAARIRDVEVIPLCHSGITTAQLPVPLGLSQGVVLTDARGLERLYRRTSDKLGCFVPEVDFEGYAERFRELEREYLAHLERHDAAVRAAADAPSAETIVRDPHVLCVTSVQYLALGFENQLQSVLDAFPPGLRHDRVRTSAELIHVLRQPTQIVHIAAYVCPRRGTLYFSDVELPGGRAVGGERDALLADDLAVLLRAAGTRLVVIGSGDSHALATTLLPVTNVVVPRDLVSAESMARWVKAFYGELTECSLAAAFRSAGMQSRVSMQLLTQQAPSHDMELAFSGASAAV